jgi:hypothetical protein
VTDFGSGSAPTAQPVGLNGWSTAGQSNSGSAHVSAGSAGSLPYGAPMPLSGGFPPPPLSPLPPPVSAEALRQQTAALIQRCYHWLESAVPVAQQVAWLTPALVTAVYQYEAQQYHASLAQTLWVVQTIGQLQAAMPTLPPL